MLAYRYKEDTKEFEYAMEAQENFIDGGFLLPIYSTFKEIPNYSEGQIPIFDIERDEWEVKKDHRNHYQVKLDDLTLSVVDYIGNAQDGYQFISDKVYNNFVEDNDRYKVIDGVFTDISDTDEYRTIKIEKAKAEKRETINGRIEELETLSVKELLFGNKENLSVYQDMIRGLEQTRDAI